MRLDYFVVFPHASEEIDGVLEILRKYDALELIYFRKYTPCDFLQFVEDIYRADTVPWQHIKGKTEYLKDVGKDCYIGLLKNHKPEEMEVGEGEYKHPQCMLINRFKWEVREKFNPVIDGERSEQHVIHTSDYEGQVRDFWSMIPFHGLKEITFNPCPYLDYIPFYIGAFNKFEMIEVDLESLDVLEMCSGENKRLNIKDSIYYKYLFGDKKPYIEYWEKYKGTRLLEDKSPAMFDKIAKCNRDFNPIMIGENRILDGNHRAVALLKSGIEKWQAINILT